jgi:ABC transport system ATP-binding/permease protein
VELVTMAKHRLGRTVLELEDATLSVGQRTLVDRQTWRIGPGDRVGIIGMNGSGKTTLLRALAGERELDGGKRVQGTTVRLAHLSQDLSDLPMHRRVLQAVEDIAERVTIGKYEQTASQLAERFGFPAARQWTPVADLSGGERRRLQLVRLLMTEPNVLMFDEPTNDLDVDTLQQLEDLLDGWPGTLVVVSHDRYLTERVCDRVVGLFGDGRITDLPGGIEEYLRRRAGQPAAPSVSSSSAPPTGDARAEGERRAARKEAARIERRLEKIATQEAALHEKLAAAATEPERLMALDAELRALVSQREQLEEAWLEASVD